MTYNDLMAPDEPQVNITYLAAERMEEIYQTGIEYGYYDSVLKGVAVMLRTMHDYDVIPYDEVEESSVPKISDDAISHEFSIYMRDEFIFSKVRDVFQMWKHNPLPNTTQCLFSDAAVALIIETCNNLVETAQDGLG